MEAQVKSRLNFKDRFMREALLENMLFSAVTGVLFYKSIVAVLLIMLASLFSVGGKVDAKRVKQRQKRAQAFNDLLHILRRLSASGLSLKQCFIHAEGEIQLMYQDPSSWIRKELQKIINHLQIETSPVPALMELGEREGIHEIVDMANILAVLTDYGGDVSIQIAKLAKNITERLETEQEIYRLASAKLFEQKVLFYLGYGMILLLDNAMTGMFDILYTTLSGRLVMTVSLGVMLLGRRLGTKLSRIEV